MINTVVAVAAVVPVPDVKETVNENYKDTTSSNN